MKSSSTVLLRQALRRRAPKRWRTLSSDVRHFSTVPAPRPESELSTKVIDLQVAANIEGSESQIVTVELRKGEKLRAESGAMLYMTEGIEMETSLGEGGAFSRYMSGQNVFLTDFVYKGEDRGTVALGTDFPSKILRLSLEEMPEQSVICQRGAYLASNPAVKIEMEFTKSMTAGFFGGQGFILQKLSGEGDVLVKGGGTIVTQDLQPNETIRATSGSIVAFERTVSYDVQMMPGITNAMFGGEGLFVTALTGPGRVWLQGMPPDRMISEIARRVPSGGPGIGIPIGGGGGRVGEEAGGDEQDGDEGPSDAVAASDAAIESDRAATVATSGAAGDVSHEDPNSPSALFGDAAPADSSGPSKATEDDSTFATEDSSSYGSSASETTFGDDDFSSSGEASFEEPSFNDEEFQSEQDFGDGELFDDTPSIEGGGEEGGFDLFGLLRDVFGSNDE